ncbi:MAG TPA: hypothetical protein VLG47_03200 [Candidatus Saccharimonadales bacterium]|nr:hypothetical protein [Candidatus Saccharimonadales bacterium]
MAEALATKCWTGEDCEFAVRLAGKDHCMSFAASLALIANAGQLDQLQGHRCPEAAGPLMGFLDIPEGQI